MDLADVTPETVAVESTPRPPCPNCGTAVRGAYCHGCGQRQHSHIAPLRALAAEALDSLFSLDSRLFRTFRVLVTQPGALTTAYLAGQRVRYVSPVRLYLIFSVLYFAVASLTDTNTFAFIHLEGEDDTAGFVKVLPRMMFVIVPGFALILRGLFRRRLFAEHLIFGLHLHAFWYLTFLLDLALRPTADQAFEDGLWTALTIPAFALYVLVQLSQLAYLYLAMGRVYGVGGGKRVLKLIALLVAYFILLAVSVGLYFVVRSFVLG